MLYIQDLCFFIGIIRFLKDNISKSSS